MKSRAVIKGGRTKLLDKKNIYLLGFMASGKSTIGKELADLLSTTFYDIDSLIEEQEAQSISQIFTSRGEAHFRQLEADIISGLKQQEAVVALGGGAFTFAANREVVASRGISIYLKWELDILLPRLMDDQERPLIEDRKGDFFEHKVRDLFASRKPSYEQADYILECTPDSAPLDIANRILNLLPELV